MPLSEDPAWEAASLAIVNEVAERTGTDPAALDPLYDVVDPDAVDALLARGFDGTIEFEYADCDVRLRGDGTISVDAPVADRDDHPIGTTTRSFSTE